MINNETYNDEDFIFKIFKALNKIKFKATEKDKFIDIFNSKTEKANLVLNAIELSLKSFQNNKENSKLNSFEIDYTSFKKQIDPDTLTTIIIDSNTYIDIQTRKILYEIKPYLKLISAIKDSPWQWYLDDNCKNNVVNDIYRGLTSNKTPFNDERFKAVPTHTDNFKNGINSSEWFKLEKGGYSNKYNIDTKEYYRSKDENFYRKTTIDAKIGFTIFFKNKPSITISFNFDYQKNIYIHQIQAQQKDRGHYKISSGDWRVKCIDYIKEVFPDYKIHLISGDSIVSIVNQYYQNPNVPDELVISKEALNIIKNNYDNIIENSQIIEKNDVYYVEYA